MKPRILFHKDFFKTLQKQANIKLVESASATAFMLENNIRITSIKTTDHGETRIRSCTKYQLEGGGRMVTIRHSGILAICYAGTHDNVEKWIKGHEGIEIVIGNKAMLFVEKKYTLPEYTKKSKTINNKNPTKKTVSNDLVVSTSPFYKLLSKKRQEYLFKGISETICERIMLLCDNEDFDTDLIKICEKIQENSSQQEANNVLNVFLSLQNKDIEGANTAIDISSGYLKRIRNLTDEEKNELIFNGSYYDWMLFLQDEQRIFVDKQYKGTAKLTGVSGSGKTCIIVRRAIHLAEQYNDSKVLVLTINFSLAHLIKDLIDKAVTGEVAETVNRKNIEVFSLFDLCKKYLKQHSKRVYLHTSKIEKDLRHIDDMWDNFYKDSLDMNEVANKLEKKNIDAKKYIREELDWIRSALTPKDRLKYTGIKRIGREYPFQKNDRKRMLAILGAWEKNMEKLKAIDYIGVSSDLHEYIDKIKNDYRCVLVDETQDFGTTELRIVRALVEQNENDIFLCGDGKQKVSCKRQEFKLANIQIKSRDTITTNYRNSNEVVKFSNAIFQENYLQKKSTSEFEAPESKNSIKSSTIPIVLEATSFSQEVEVAYAYCLSKTINSDKRACIAICGYSLYEISKYARKHNVDFMHDEEKQKVKPVVFSDLEHTKGFEFDYVFIVNCNDNVMPDTKKPLKEQCIDLNRLYVAMTRAKVELVISFSKNTASDRSKYITLKAKYKSLYDEENYENIAKDLNIKKKFSDI